MYSDEERAALREYDEYHKRYFPLEKYPHLDSYWISNFNESGYYNPETQTNNESRLAALNAYLSDMEPFTERLTHFTKLRQSHYERFIQNIKPEEEGHENARRKFLLIAKDARQKIAYWQKQRDALLNNFFDQKAWNTTHVSSVMLVLGIDDVDFYDKEEFADVIVKPEPVKKPKLSRAEKERRKRQYLEIQGKRDTAAIAQAEKEMQQEEERHRTLLQNVDFQNHHFRHYDMNDFVKTFDAFYFKINHGEVLRPIFFTFTPSTEDYLAVVLKIFYTQALKRFTSPDDFGLVISAIMRFGYDTIELYHEKSILGVLDVYARARVNRLDFLVILAYHYDSFEKFKTRIRVQCDGKMDHTTIDDIVTMWFMYRLRIYIRLMRMWNRLLEVKIDSPAHKVWESYIQNHPFFRKVWYDPILSVSARDRKNAFKIIRMDAYRKLVKQYHQERQRLLRHFPLYMQIKTAIMPFCLHCLQDAALVDSEYRWTFCNEQCREDFYDSLFINVE